MRRNVVAIISVFAALAIGLALGAGPLNRDDAKAAPTTSEPSAADVALKQQAQEGDAFASAISPALLKGELNGEHVAMIVMPGASTDVVQALDHDVAAAGGDVQSTLTLANSAFDSGSKALVDTLGSQLAAQLHSGVVKTDPTYARFGELLGMSVGASSTHSIEFSTDQQTARSSLVTAKLGSIDGGKSPSPAPVVLVVLGDSIDHGLLASVVHGIGATVHGLVVAGSTASGASGNLQELRSDLPDNGDDKKVATVDGDDTTIGQTVAILALVHQITGGGGSFGASGVDGFQPLA